MTPMDGDDADWLGVGDGVRGGDCAMGPDELPHAARISAIARTVTFMYTLTRAWDFRYGLTKGGAERVKVPDPSRTACRAE
jgi:hypothetical protein